jgi:tryptophanyl-tRNA synthetase
MRVLSGIQPSGILHIGNYFGMIKRVIESQDENDLFLFVANYHALTSISDKDILKEHTLNAAIDMLALGIDPNKTTFWIQSDVEEVMELYWILSKYTPMGLLERAHSYKDKVAKGIAPSHALFSYPVLMAADILLFDSQSVPVGKDQIQHLEITRDIAIKFNNDFGEIFTLPEAKVEESVATVIGTDGAKMSKSYNNTINIFDTLKKRKKSVGKIVTDSTPLEEPKEWENCNVYKLSQLFMNSDELIELQERYRGGKEGYGHFKKSLYEKIDEYFAPYNEKREYLLNNKDEVYEILNSGAKKAKSVARTRLDAVKDAIGLRY